MRCVKLDFTCFLLLVACVFLFSGCKKETGLKGLSPISGKITMNGSPVEGASISLSPDFTGENARSASATSDMNGEFKIRTLNPDDGAFPGEYSIAVQKMVADKTYTEAEIDEANAKGVSLQINAKNVLPKKYEKTKTSGLKITVVEGKNEDLIIDLSDK